MRFKLFSNFNFRNNLLRHYCSKRINKEHDIKELRNIGIFAHIDAGKTTTTERMLFFSGTITRMGEVHHGNTVTDYMEQERDRGITIKSAAISFPWKMHQFNLIDTPGHIDFTMEVEQTLQVLDGAIIVLDGSAGVEAQTLTVWRQADRYAIPRIIYVNKMDRSDADLSMCCKSIESKLDSPTLLLHTPLWENGKFVGVIDIIRLEKLAWNSIDNKLHFSKHILTEKDGQMWAHAIELRHKLIDLLSDFDDHLASTIIEAESFDRIALDDLQLALLRTIYNRKAVPVLCGSSYKNIGIQPLMDAIILYLPNPLERTKEYSIFNGNLCARAFKIIHDKQRGVLTFFRIYSGELSKGQRIYNIRQDISEQIGRLLIAFADDYEEIGRIENGNIAVVTGLKHTIIGDLVTNSSSTAQNVKNKLAKISISSEVDNSLNTGTKIPEPVFFCSIEPPSLSYQQPLEIALAELQREDPSLRVTQDTETGQTVLAGMGELHLEIIKDRILKEYKIDADLGPLQIAYREAPLNDVTMEHSNVMKIGNSKQNVSIKMSLNIVADEKIKDIFILDKSPESVANVANIWPKHLQAIKRGVLVGLAHGPRVGCQVVNAVIILHNFIVVRGTTDSVISATATQCVQKLLTDSSTSILEPIMFLEIVTPDEYLSSILADLTKRRAVIQNIVIRGQSKIVNCETPLTELMGYSTSLRRITSGTGTFNMEFIEYKNMTSIEEQKAIQRIRGF